MSDLNDAFREWLREALEFYKKLGYFASGEEGLFERLEETLTEGQPLKEFDPKNTAYDLALLSYDPERCLMESPQLGALLAPGNRVFIQTLEQLAKISRGTFKPEDIKEEWASRKGPVRITYRHNGKPHTLVTPADAGELDPVLLLQLNLALFRSAMQFELVTYSDPQGKPMFFVTTLHQEERFLIEHARRIPFVIYSLPRSLVPVGRICPHPDFSEPVNYSGTVNEFLDRCVGKLEFTLDGKQLTGHLVYEGEDHQESLDFAGELDARTGRLSGKVSGLVCTPERGDEDFTGNFHGKMEHDGRTLSGFWKGWVADLGEDEPKDSTLLNIGEWAVLHEHALKHDDPHVKRVKDWLDRVWAATRPEEYPWTY